MKVIGITGGIGAGKSTVSKLLSEKLSAPILDADKISKQAYSSPEILKKIKEFFGNVIFDTPKIINSARLASIVFSSEEKLLQLNKIIHPYVMEEIAKSIAELSVNNTAVILDVPLPNSDFINMCDKIIVVTAYESLRIKRVMERSHLTEEQVKKRMKKQMPQDGYIKLADIVIKNNDSEDELKEFINSLKI